MGWPQLSGDRAAARRCRWVEGWKGGWKELEWSLGESPHTARPSGSMPGCSHRPRGQEQGPGLSGRKVLVLWTRPRPSAAERLLRAGDRGAGGGDANCVSDTVVLPTASPLLCLLHL